MLCKSFIKGILNNSSKPRSYGTYGLSSVTMDEMHAIFENIVVSRSNTEIIFPHPLSDSPCVATALVHCKTSCILIKWAKWSLFVQTHAM